VCDKYPSRRRHRAHARVEDRICIAKDTGRNRFPSRAADLIAWTQTMLLHDQPTLARAEPKTLRYRLLHVAARPARDMHRSSTCEFPVQRSDDELSEYVPRVQLCR
jgi:hypothetical protein